MELTNKENEEKNRSLASRRKEAEALEASTIPAGRAANPSEVADAVAFLAGDGSAYMTGVALPVSGGMPPGL